MQTERGKLGTKADLKLSEKQIYSLVKKEIYSSVEIGSSHEYIIKLN